MKTPKLMLWLVMVAWLAIIVVAQAADATNAPPVTGLPADLPMGKDAIWLALIAPITFAITWVAGKIPKLPKAVLPWLTPFVGIGIGAVMQWATKANFPWWSAAGSGMIATTIYEAVKNATKAGPESPLTPTPDPDKPIPNPGR